MKIFVTGASGFVGSAVVAELVRAGHEVVGLARSDEAAKSVVASGATVARGTLDDLDGLARAAKDAGGVVHTAFVHDFTNYAASVAIDARAIEAMGNALAGTGKPFVVTSGTRRVGGGVAATEDMPADPNFPRRSEMAALPFAEREVRVSVVRLPPTTHGAGDRGFVPELVRIARDKRVSAYVGDGANRWAAVHRADAAKVFRIALEKAPAGTRLHAVAEESIPTKRIAETIGAHLGVPVEPRPAEHFGWLGSFFSFDVPTSSEITRRRFGWEPTAPGLLDDMAAHYF